LRFFYRLGKEREKATRLEDMTPSERLLWYRRNVAAVEEDRFATKDRQR
jgi:hypothetical protein